MFGFCWILIATWAPSNLRLGTGRSIFGRIIWNFDTHLGTWKSKTGGGRWVHVWAQSTYLLPEKVWNEKTFSSSTDSISLGGVFRFVVFRQAHIGCFRQSNSGVIGCSIWSLSKTTKTYILWFSDLGGKSLLLLNFWPPFFLKKRGVRMHTCICVYIYIYVHIYR